MVRTAGPARGSGRRRDMVVLVVLVVDVESKRGNPIDLSDVDAQKSKSATLGAIGNKATHVAETPSHVTAFRSLVGHVLFGRPHSHSGLVLLRRLHHPSQASIAPVGPAGRELTPWSVNPFLTGGSASGLDADLRCPELTSPAPAPSQSVTLHTSLGDLKVRPALLLDIRQSSLGD